MWFVVGLPNFHPCWCWLFRWGGGIVWTLNSMWPFFSQQRLLENLQSSEWTMIIACILKTQNTKLGWLLELNKANLWDGVFLLLFFAGQQRGSTYSATTQNQAATEAFEATAGRYRCVERQQRSGNGRFFFSPVFVGNHISKRQLQQTPGTYPRPSTTCLWRKSFHIRILGGVLLWYVPCKGMVWLVSANYRGPVPGRLGIPPTCGGAFWGNLSPQNRNKHHSDWGILVLWASFGGKKTPAVVLSNQLNRIFCIGCLFVSFFLS